MPFRKIAGTDVEYGLISFDKDGKERTDDPNGGAFSKTLLARAISDKPTNVFLFSHGWKGDIDAAIDQYDRWIGAMARLTADQQKMGGGFKPMWIGLHWPSQPWGEEQQPAGVSFAAGPEAKAAFNKMLDSAVEHFGGGEAVRKPLEIIFKADQEDAGAVEVPPDVLQAYQELAAAIGFRAGRNSDAAPDEEGALLDPQAAMDAANLTGSSFGLGSSLINGLKSGLRQLSFWTMKKRARTVGEQGMHQFVAALLDNTSADVHLMGHSFGCVVVSSILGGPNGKGKLPRAIASAALVQGAVSLWSWSDKVLNSNQPGYFNNILVNKAVSGPVITTKSRHDLAVGVLYPAAVALVGDVAFASTLPPFGGIGSFGIQGTQSAVPLDMRDENAEYGFEAGRIYNLESSNFIKKMDGASGAHSDIDGPQVAHAIWQAAFVGSRKRLASHG